jgi:hypothetical protein
MVQRSTLGSNPREPDVAAAPAKSAGKNKHTMLAIISAFEPIVPLVDDEAEDSAEDSPDSEEDSLCDVVATRRSLFFFLTFFLLFEL